MLKAVQLVRKGYFPREVPPPFTTVPLADLFDADPSALDLRGKWTEPTRHNLARLSGFRRLLKVPNPRHYILLAQTLEKHWTEINTHVNASRFAISRPVVTKTAERAVRPRFRVGEREKLRPRHWRGQRFLLRSDVSQFYSSVYTHSIPWALHGKPYAKQNMGKTHGDELDKAFQHGSNGQTIGIPIGPDGSFVAAEILLAAVDAKLDAKIGPLRGHRYLDDYEFAFETRAQAENAQGNLERELGDLELVINPFKTHILELPQPFRESWTHAISVFPIRTETESKTLTDAIALFSHAAEVARRRAGALKYALLTARSVPISTQRVWRPFQGLVWSAVSAEPTTMATALDLLAVKSKESDLDVDKDGAAEVFETLIRMHAPVRNASEVAWALWGAIALDVKLSTGSAAAVSTVEDDFVALLSLDASARDVLPARALDTNLWESTTNYNDVLLGPHWLLAFEGATRRWLTSPVPRVGKDPFFSVLQAHAVHFYDDNPQRAPFTGPAGSLPGGLVPDEYL